MTATFLVAFQSEWLKRRRSFASSMVIAGSLFTPAIVAVVRLFHYRGLPRLYAQDGFWQALWHDSWESMAIFFLPLGAILATSLVTQIEFKSNAWKQVHTLPMSMAVVFLAKLGVILVMLLQFLALFTAGIYLSAMIPMLLVPGVPHPKGSFAALPLLRENALYFVDCLPIIGAQYVISLRSNNALVPIGAGFMAWVAALAAVSSKHAIWWPYAYTIVHYLQGTPKGKVFAANTTFHWLAALSFALMTILGYVLFVTNKEKG